MVTARCFKIGQLIADYRIIIFELLSFANFDLENLIFQKTVKTRSSKVGQLMEGNEKITFFSYHLCIF